VFLERANYRAYVFALILTFGVPCAAAEPMRSPSEPADSPTTADSETDSAGLAYTPQWPEPPDTGAMLLRLGAGTAFVLVLCVGTLWFGRRWLGKVATVASGGNQLRLQESTALGNRCYVHLIQVGECRALAGTDGAGLKSLVILPNSFVGVLDDELKTMPAETHAETARLDNMTFANTTTVV